MSVCLLVCLFTCLSTYVCDLVVNRGVTRTGRSAELGSGHLSVLIAGVWGHVGRSGAAVNRASAEQGEPDQ